ncbi:transcription factor HES-4-B-like [Amphibalanus amphitrite]|uniref:transcription factor HES-4-B-like n=1 Tax=Amphibalanus amphitrite TaxID=1232801 RepID=UPI001C910A49|nr:transcription factor HES-4-B-like [Amphibalanus amphitrite]
MERRQPKPAKPMSELRKIRKPIMEKKRRERINSCLANLRDMLIDENAVQRQGPKPSKLEKADILEQTVAHVRELQARLRLGAASTAPVTPSLADSYRAGYQRCLQVVRSFSGMADGPGALPRLVLSLEQGLDHLQSLGAGISVGSGGSGSTYQPPSPHSLASESPRSDASPRDGWAAAAAGAGDTDAAQWSSVDCESSDSSAEESDVLDLTSHAADGRAAGDAVWRPW